MGGQGSDHLRPVQIHYARRWTLWNSLSQ